MPSPELMPTFDQEEKPKRTYPRGWRPWMCVVGCCFLMFNSWGLVNAYGTFASFYKQEVDPGREFLWWNFTGATQTFLILSFSLVVGRLLDANQSRYLICAGSILTIGGLWLLTLTTERGSFGNTEFGLMWFTQGFIVGIGQACFFVTSAQLVATWFDKGKYLAMGIVASGASIGGLIYPVMLKPLIPYLGFNNSVRAVTALTAVTCAISIAFCAPNPNYAFKEVKNWRQWDSWIDRGTLRNPAYLLFCAACGFIYLGFYPIFFSLEEWASAQGFGLKDPPPGSDISELADTPPGTIRTFYLLATLSAVSTFGRISAAALSEKFGPLEMHALSTGVGGLLCLCLWPFVTTLNSAWAFVCVFGAFSGAIIGMPPATVAAIQRATDPDAGDRLGRWTGLAFLAAAVPAMVGPLVTGHLVSVTYGSYLPLQMWSGGSFVLAAACMGAARVAIRRRRRRPCKTSRR